MIYLYTKSAGKSDKKGGEVYDAHPEKLTLELKKKLGVYSNVSPFARRLFFRFHVVLRMHFLRETFCKFLSTNT